MDQSPLYTLASRVGAALQARGFMLVTAESCTGGLVGAAMTDVPGSSAWFERGFITYSNDAKMELLGVPMETLSRFGAVSRETVEAMVRGALAHSRAQVAVAISGVAGPGGGTTSHPVGMVCFAWGVANGTIESTVELLAGDRQAVRLGAVEIALKGLLKALV